MIIDKSLSKSQLATKRIKYLTRFGRYLIIGFDLAADHMTLHFNGTDVSTLPVPELSLEIHRNRIEDKTTADQR